MWECCRCGNRGDGLNTRQDDTSYLLCLWVGMCTACVLIVVLLIWMTLVFPLTIGYSGTVATSIGGKG